MSNKIMVDSLFGVIDYKSLFEVEANTPSLTPKVGEASKVKRLGSLKPNTKSKAKPIKSYRERVF